MFRRLIVLFPLALITISYVGALPCRGEDWPQWMGEGRDNVLQDGPTLTKFAKGGPKVVWRSPVAGGYAGPAVIHGKVFVHDFKSDSDVKIANFQREPATGVESLICLDAETGAELWRHSYPLTYSISYPAGPRCTPIVDGDDVIALGAEGNLFRVSIDDGSVIWEKDLKSEYSTKSALWGYASHPLIYGDLLICVVGGDGSHTVAFNKSTGNEIWRYGTAGEQGYVPPTLINAGGKEQLITVCPTWIASLDPNTGEPFWTTDYEATSGSVIMSPIQIDNHLFFGGYSKRNIMLELAADTPQAKVLWRDKAKMGLSPVNVQPIAGSGADAGVIFGMDQSGEMIAFEVPSGERLWTSTEIIGERAQGSDTAFIVRSGENYILFNEKGELVLAKMSREKLEVLDRAKIIEPTNNAFGRDVVWCAPAFAGTRVYVRNDAECICVELGE